MTKTFYERPSGIEIDQLEIETALKDLIVRILQGDVNGIYFDPDEHPIFSKRLSDLVEALTIVPADLRRPQSDPHSVATILEGIVHLLTLTLEAHLRNTPT